MSTTDTEILRAQRIVDLRQRMLDNISRGAPSHEGITPEELRDVINDIRSSRQVSGARGGTASGKSKAAAAAITPEQTKKLQDKLAQLGFKLDLG